MFLKPEDIAEVLQLRLDQVEGLLDAGEIESFEMSTQDGRIERYVSQETLGRYIERRKLISDMFSLERWQRIIEEESRKDPGLLAEIDSTTNKPGSFGALMKLARDPIEREPGSNVVPFRSKDG